MVSLIPKHIPTHCNATFVDPDSNPKTYTYTL